MNKPKIHPLTTYQVSRYLNVDLTTVINWCDQGKIRAYRTPGGHRRVEPMDFLSFLKEFQLPIPKEFVHEVSGERRVLIVDDESEIRRVVAKAFQKHFPDIQLFEARDGFEAGKMVLDSLPSLIILDLMLPGVNGFAVCENIRADERFKDAKILAITGQSTNENRDKILAAGADDFLAKPFELHDLISKVSALLELQEAVR